MTLQEFLVLEETIELDRFVLESANSLLPARVVQRGSGEVAVASRQRSAHSMNAPAWVFNLFRERLYFHFPSILQSIGYPVYKPESLEAQITSSRDGDFFGRHNDDVDSKVPTRETTYVYFFHSEPTAFQGGQLVIYPPKGSEANPAQIQPARNHIAVFPSFLTHEILPVHCPSSQILRSRLTVNGWIHGPTGKSDRQAKWYDHWNRMQLQRLNEE